MSKQSWFIEIITSKNKKDIKQLEKLSNNLTKIEVIGIHLDRYLKHRYQCNNISQIYRLQSKIERLYHNLFILKIGMIQSDPQFGIKENLMVNKSIYNINERREFNDDSSYVMDAIMVTNLRYKNDNKETILN